MADANQSEKVALITGGARGIGEGIAALFRKRGVGHVFFCDIRENQELITSGCKFIRCDVTKEDDIKACIDEIIKQQGRLDYLINNAGWHPPHMPIDDFSVDDFRKLLDLNTVSVFAFCKYAMPHLRKVKGSIVNLSSLVTHLGQAGAATYCASKGAIHSMMKALAIDEATHGVRVNSVAPSNAFTPLWSESLSGLPEEEAKQRIEIGGSLQLIGRMVTVDEIAEGAWYLAAVASGTTGFELMVTGGAELNYGKKTRIGASPYSFTS